MCVKAVVSPLQNAGQDAPPTREDYRGSQKTIAFAIGPVDPNRSVDLTEIRRAPSLNSQWIRNPAPPRHGRCYS